MAQLLCVIFAKVQLMDWRPMEGEDIVGRLEFGDSHEPYLESLLAMMHEDSETLTAGSEDATKNLLDGPWPPQLPSH